MLRRFVHSRYSSAKAPWHCQFSSPEPDVPATVIDLRLPLTPDAHILDTTDIPRPPISNANQDRASLSNESTTVASDSTDDEPPSYAESENITEPITFTFSQSSFNTMLLDPRSDMPENLPLFHVSVDLNCFNPAASVTTVRRGGSEDAPVMGSFQMGLSSGYSFVTIRGQRRAINRVFLKVLDSNRRHVWLFYQNQPLVFVWRGEELTCSTTQRGSSGYSPLQTLSVLHAQSLYNANGRTKAILEIWPEAYNNRTFLAQAIIGTLILERRRQLPARSTKWVH